MIAATLIVLCYSALKWLNGSETHLLHCLFPIMSAPLQTIEASLFYFHQNACHIVSSSIYKRLSGQGLYSMFDILPFTDNLLHFLI